MYKSVINTKFSMHKYFPTSIIILALVAGLCLAGKPLEAFSAVSKANIISWVEPKVTPKAVVLCLHGLGLHKSAFQGLGTRLAASGVITYAMDLPGFGAATRENQRLDFEHSLTAVKEQIDAIHQTHPSLPIFLLGESMGGAIALQVSAAYQDKLAGLISSVPSGDRFSSGKAKVALSAITRGFNKPMPVGDMLIKQATDKPELRAAWLNDPEARLQLTPNELMRFQTFMNENFSEARKVTKLPVLFVQGSHDKLVRPAGTWDLFDYLSTADRERVLSTTGEHLIFEANQFSSDDFNYLLSWITKHIPAKENVTTSKANIPADPDDAAVAPGVMAMNYWIELLRGGKTYRCNNKMTFKTGDEIRFHLMPKSDGYAYIIMTAGSSGNQAILFPNPDTGMDNHLKGGRDYPLPTTARLKFDDTPGIERINLVYSPNPIDAQAFLNTSGSSMAFLSSDKSGAKDLVPTRMELSWDDPAPVIMPDDLQQRLGKSSIVKMIQREPGAVLAVQIALEHQ